MNFLFYTEPFVSYFGLQRTNAVNYESFEYVTVEFYPFSANTTVLKVLLFWVSHFLQAPRRPRILVWLCVGKYIQ